MDDSFPTAVAAATAAATTAAAAPINVEAEQSPHSSPFMKSPLAEALGHSPAPANTGSTASGDDSLPGPSTTSKAVQPDSGLNANNSGPAPECSHDTVAAAADAAADCEEQGRAQGIQCRDSPPCHHADCPAWLPDQVNKVQQHYAAAEVGAGLVGNALLGQRVSFALLEDFQQVDSRQEVDVLLAGLHTGQ